MALKETLIRIVNLLPFREESHVQEAVKDINEHFAEHEELKSRLPAAGVIDANGENTTANGDEA